MEGLIRNIKEKITGRKYVSSAEREIGAVKTQEQLRFPKTREEYETKLRKRIGEITDFGDISEEDREKVCKALPFEKQMERNGLEPSVLREAMSEVLGRKPNASGAAAPVVRQKAAKPANHSRAA